MPKPTPRAPKSILRSHKGPLSLRDIFKLIPEHAEAVVLYYESVMRGPSPLSAGEREFIYSYCSALNLCHFAHTSHKAAAIGLGIDPKAFDHLAGDLRDAPIAKKFKPIVKFARKLTLSPGLIEPSDADAIYAAGWSEKAIADTILVVSLTAWIDRVLNGFCAWSPDEQHRANGENLAKHGYLPVARQVTASLERPVAKGKSKRTARKTKR